MLLQVCVVWTNKSLDSICCLKMAWQYDLHIKCLLFASMDVLTCVSIPTYGQMVVFDVFPRGGVCWFSDFSNSWSRLLSVRFYGFQWIVARVWNWLPMDFFFRFHTQWELNKTFACLQTGGEISLMEGFPASGKVHQKPAVDGSQNGGTGHTSEQPSEVDKKQVVNNCASSLPESVSTATKEAASTGGSMLVYPNLQPDVGGLYPKLPGQDAGDLPAGGTGGPFGFYNGAWPYGFNVRWNGAVPAVSPGVVGSGQVLPGNGLATWSPPPNGVWTGAGVIPWASPIPGMPSLPWIVPPGWGGGWTVPMPWAAAAAQAAASTANGSVLPGTTMPVLGKHSREWPEGRRVDGALWAPKTLRIDDPKDAARSSVWNALGMPNPPESLLSGSKFKAFQLKAETKVRAESQPQQVKQSTGQQL